MRLRKLFFLATACALAVSAAPNELRHVAGRLLAQPIFSANQRALAATYTRSGIRIHHTISGINVHVLQTPEGAEEQVAAALMKTGLFTYVEPDYIATAATTLTPNDPNFSSQWHLASINAPSAWSITTGAAGAPIAIIDSGVDSTHPDLSSKLVAGWNFVTGTSNTADDYGHGTAVAGVAAAATNNGIGIAGVSWNNPIMPLVVIDSTGSASYSNIDSAIQYAADHGARIINISLGGPSSSSALQSAVNYAWSKGAVIFAASGNSSTSTPMYPAACTSVVAVSGTEPNGTLASFSDYGSYIDLAAPGDSILTTMSGGGYGYWEGTSFSSPIVAATAALALSVKPGLSASALVNLLEQNADPLGGYSGWNQYFGYGQVDAYKTVVAAQNVVGDTTPPTVSINGPANGATVSGTVQVTGTATDNVGVTSIQFSVDGKQVATSATSPFLFSWNTAGYANASHTITVSASDAAGNVGTASISVSVSNISNGASTLAVFIGSPVSGTTIAASTNNVTITASVTDSLAIAQVAFYIDNTLKCTDTTASYNCVWNTKKSAVGNHTIKVTAWDSSGASVSATESVYKQ
jgi:subtilisin family serine protease